MDAFADALVSPLVRSGFRPNTLTVLAFLSGLSAGALIAVNRPAAALTAGILSNIFDGIDGRVAAATNRRSRFGAMLDSTLDRYVEFFVFGGLAFYFRGRWPSVLALFALMGAILVSYARARAEGLGFDCRIGWMQKPDRFVVIGLGMLIGLIFRILDPSLIVALSIIALGSHFTALQRLFHVRTLDQRSAVNISPRP